MRSGPVVEKRVLEGILERLGSPGGYDAFVSQVRAARCCRRPVRLAGRITETDEAGRRRVAFDSAELPDGVLLKACGTRRESLCPPCASIYRGDAYQLLAAGLRGGKGIPEEVAGHPAVFLTLTAPSFGAVHRRSADGSCQLAGRRCPHGVALLCPRHHDEDDEALGQALCGTCYDYERRCCGTRLSQSSGGAPPSTSCGSWGSWPG
ncbi:MAG TPA: replication initiator [Acidimicrobiales bacterium]|nr:replication initiator [Acidimicrobiales bacterium]